ncbi:MAG: CBS domain-containing protein [Candidatus Woesearchaeota archaeon]|nr:CBS domain-containing protein [Candidatus Woesearchaeota archaeon]
MKTGYKVCDAMTREPITVPSEATIKECAKTMEKNHVGALLITRGKKILGIISEQDIVRKVVARGLDYSKLQVKHVMAKKLISISPAADIYEALVKMRDANIRHLPVIDGTNLIGLLTIKDVLKIQPQLFDLVVEKFELREEENKPVRERGDAMLCEICGNYAEKLYQVKNMLVCSKCKKSV